MLLCGDAIKSKIIIDYHYQIYKDRLKTVETEKLRKYKLLKKNELAMMYKCEVEVIPYVLTWDGLVKMYRKANRTRIGLDKNVEAYIQPLTLKKTLESISIGISSNSEMQKISREKKIEDALNVFYEEDTKVNDGVDENRIGT